MNHLKFEKIINVSEKGNACDLLAQSTGLSKTAIKQAMKLGAVWHRRGKAKQRRIRRATFEIRPEDRLAIYYDQSVLTRQAPAPLCIKDHQHYSIWFKPAGLMTQGSRYGDHCALSRQVERYFSRHRKVYVVHRIDRETSGLLILCHNRQAAAHFSGMFKRREIKKGYDVWVRGDLRVHGDRGEINFPLDGRKAQTTYRCTAHHQEMNESRAHVEISTGRTHQIRRHFNMIGYPVVGDPRYGEGNKNRTGLKLVAKSLVFTCPFQRQPVMIHIDPDCPPGDDCADAGQLPGRR